MTPASRNASRDVACSEFVIFKAGRMCRLVALCRAAPSVQDMPGSLLCDADTRTMVVRYFCREYVTLPKK